jgi:adenine-specific DNA-methyltransferase
MPPRQPKQPKKVEALKHEAAKRKNIPTAEHQSVMAEEDKSPIAIAYERRNQDLDPQLVWRGKDEQDWSDLVVSAPPLYIQEKVHPKVIIEDLRRQSQERSNATQDNIQLELDFFADFNGLPKDATATEFYQHDANWTNRMILGDSLQVMASLAEREGLRGKVQCIYFDPPYGIKFNSNFQWSTTSRDVKDGKLDQITREPEQVKAFRDTWRDGIHSYLTYLRDRLTVARDLLTDSGSIFVQIGDENVHRVRALMDEVFGDENFISLITLQKTGGLVSQGLVRTLDYICWYSKNTSNPKIRQLYLQRESGDTSLERYDLVNLSDGSFRRITSEERLTSKLPQGARRCRQVALESANPTFEFQFQGKAYIQRWKTNFTGLQSLSRSGRISSTGKRLNSLRYVDDFSVIPLTDRWESMQIGTGLTYVVQTAPAAVQNCILMATDPGDLVLDPTCGSGTTAYVAEQWGRRWITIDTSRVALALARARIMGARYPYYLLADSPAGQQKEAEINRTFPATNPTQGNIRLGFVYDRVPHITLKSIANNTEIDTIWETYQAKLEPLRAELNRELGKTWEEWEIPREVEANWSSKAQQLHGDWWQQRIARQKEIDDSIAAKADQELLYDKPYEDKNIVRVAGPFTVESLSPHRVLAVDENDELIDPQSKSEPEETDFVNVILENLRTSGVQQAHKEGKINFTSLVGFPGDLICAEGRYIEGENNQEKRAGIFIGSEFGTVSRPDLVEAAREAGDLKFDVLISCAFNYDAHSAEFNKLGRIPVLKARMNADLHMANDLKNTGAGNLFVIFGEPDIDINTLDDGNLQVKIHGVDVFHPQSGEVRSSNADEIACWFIDTDYNEESFFVRHAYFLGANDPYKSLKTTLKAEIDEEAWSSLHSDTSRPFTKPKSGRIAVKVINHLGDEVMKVFGVS